MSNRDVFRPCSRVSSGKTNNQWQIQKILVGGDNKNFKHKTSKIRMSSPKLRLIFRNVKHFFCPKSGGLQKKKRSSPKLRLIFRDFKRFFRPKSGGLQKKKKRSSPKLRLTFRNVKRFFHPKSGGLQKKKKRSSPKLRLIFRPKTLGVGWWGGMHPPILLL